MQNFVRARTAEIEEICRRFYVRRLDIFGSAAREDFDPARSDVDFVAEFERDHPLGGFEAYFGLKEALENLFGRPVDLVSANSIRNPFIRADIERSRRLPFRCQLGDAP